MVSAPAAQCSPAAWNESPLAGSTRGGEKTGRGCLEHKLGGHVVVTIDQKNAFNTPQRQFMWEQLANFPELHGVFHVLYGGHSSLFVAGTCATLSSERGTRQGTCSGRVTRECDQCV